MDISPIIDFLDDLEQNPKKGLQYATGLLVCSLLLLFVVPNLILGSYDRATVAQIQSVSTSLQTAEQRAPTQNWYAEPYLQLEDNRHFQLWLDDAHSLLEADVGASSIYKDAKFGWPAARLRLYESAQATAEQAQAKVDSVVALFDRNDTLRGQVLQTKQNLTDAWNLAGVTQEHAQDRYDREANEFLTVHMNPLADNLRQSSQKIQQVEQLLALSAGYLPDFGDLSNQGDPNKAQEGFNSAQALITEINSLQNKVTSGLDYQVEARDNSRRRSEEAATAIELAAIHLTDIDSQYHWGFAGALMPASTSVANARVNLQTALLTMESFVPGENKIDWPTAYEAAKLSLSQAQLAVQQVDEQVAFYGQANQFLASYSQTAAVANADISSASSAWNVIETYHSSTVWDGKQGHVAAANSKVSEAEEARANAQFYLGTQQFADARSQAEAAIFALQGASSLSVEVVDLKDELEGYRDSWPSKASTASSTIESNRSQVDSYGGYDSGAVASFNHAVDLLTQANAHAAAREYGQACSLADQATVSATGTGQQAEDAYDDEMQRQEDARRRAQEAAEEAARQAQEQSSSPSSSCCSSSSDDGGGYGGGGYDDGGGYDSSPSYDDGGGY